MWFQMLMDSNVDPNSVHVTTKLTCYDLAKEFLLVIITNAYVFCPFSTTCQIMK